MANELDELTGPVNEAGREVSVINKQIPVEVGVGSLIFEIALWIIGPAIAWLITELGLIPAENGLLYAFAGVLPGPLFILLKVNALAYLRKLQQKMQADASQIDNYLEQRVMILQNVVGLVQKSIELDKDIMKSVAAYRSGGTTSTDGDRNTASQRIDAGFSRLNVAFEAYPDIRAHAAIADAMQQNSYLQKEITAARTLYNDTVSIWNQDIFSWPAKQIVAARKGYTTRIPFIASTETRVAARGTFF